MANVTSVCRVCERTNSGERTHSSVCRVCVTAVCRVSILNATGVQPLTGLLSVHHKGGLPEPPPVISHPESLACPGGLYRGCSHVRITNPNQA